MRWKERGAAAALHLLASLLVALLAAVLVLGVWFPYPYRYVVGGLSLFLLVVGVDVVMGPLLTFAVFNRTKPRTELVRDLAIIALLQLGALGYGLVTAFQARPLYLVHEVDRFRVVRAADLDPAELADAPAGLGKPSWNGVRVIGTRAPRDSQEMLESVESALAGRDIAVRPNWWQPLGADNARSIRQRARSFDVVRSRAGVQSGELERIVADAGVPREHVVGLPMIGHSQDDWTVLLDARDLRIVGYLQVDLF